MKNGRGGRGGGGGRHYDLGRGTIIRRARGFYLYDNAGGRYLDLWQADGSALLGHRPDRYSSLAKMEIDRGLWAPLPTPWPGRLQKALAALAALAAPLGTAPTVLVIINGTSAASRAGSRRWLPGARDLPAGSAAEQPVTAPLASPPASTELELVLPAPGITVDPELAPESYPSFVAALLTRAAWNLVQYISSPEMTARQKTARITPVPPGYRREGIWCLPEGEEPLPETTARETALERWHTVQTLSLAARIVVPPDPWTPIVLPERWNSAEERAWKRICDDWPR